MIASDRLAAVACGFAGACLLSLVGCTWETEVETQTISILHEPEEAPDDVPIFEAVEMPERLEDESASSEAESGDLKNDSGNTDGPR
ncbi:hypothetical protein [Alienimonas chondri]|uniref:Secreted protein n=1 Tax=Alienimonas chondri TaxID=2681879 RepID=A0ABX1VDB1_9PLAN|nr:hypothetical protein [Alienimonas chondri]NNJ26039.1 hypothetical protein [Alienimonas chondri]